MKSLNVIGPLIMAVSLFSCSNTTNISQDKVMNYHQSSFEKTEFTPVNETTVKKSFVSDHHLMMSLLNRPITADQAMMLAFTRQIQKQDESMALVNFVTIRGDKNQDSDHYNQTTSYSTLIAKDINSINISGSL